MVEFFVHNEYTKGHRQRTAEEKSPHGFKHFLGFFIENPFPFFDTSTFCENPDRKRILSRKSKHTFGLSLKSGKIKTKKGGLMI